MAIAGKVAITPGGEWSVDVAYDKLVVVTFGNNVYLSIKPSTGIEPTNEEHWMLLIENVTAEDLEAIINGTTAVGNALQLGGKGASEYALIAQETLNDSVLEKASALSDGVYNYRLGGTTYTGNDLPHSQYAYSIARIKKRSSKHITVTLSGTNINGDERPPVYNHYGGTDWVGWKTIATTADLAKYLPKTNTSKPTVSTPSNDVIIFNNNLSSGTHAWLNLQVNGVDVGAFGFNDSGKAQVWVNNASREILHTGNKPTGSYTGNGSATERTISTGGIGQFLILWSANGMGIVSPLGGWLFDTSGSVSFLSSVRLYYSSGTLKVATDNAIVNGNGASITYHAI